MHGRTQAHVSQLFQDKWCGRRRANRRAAHELGMWGWERGKNRSAVLFFCVLKWADSFQSCLQSPFMRSLPLIAPSVIEQSRTPFYFFSQDHTLQPERRQLRFHQNRTIKVRRKRYLHPAGCFLWDGNVDKGWKKSLRVCVQQIQEKAFRFSRASWRAFFLFSYVFIVFLGAKISCYVL